MNPPPSQAPTRKRRLLAISLRSFLLAITVLALAFGWVANRAIRQRAAVAAIERQGGRILYSYEFPPAYTAAGQQPPSLAGLLGIDFVDHVTAVELLGPEFDDADLPLLNDLPHVQWLRIYETKVTGATFEHVARCRRVNSLLVNYSPLEDQALPAIGRLTRLQTLHLVGTKITDAELDELRGLDRLKDVSLSGCPITGTGLARLELPDTLTDLSLEETNVGDDGVAHLACLPALARLSLYGSPVTDASIGTLEKMPQLTTIILGSTKVTNEGLQRLHKERGPAMFVSPDPNGLE